MPAGDVIHYISPSGSDSNDGLSLSTAWASPNHAIHCGDVIIAAAGNYTSGNIGSGFGATSNCPSTTGGIDGAGGIYFAILLCGGIDLQSCQVTGQNTDGAGVFNVSGVNNWAIEGFKVNGSGNSRGFMVADQVPGTVFHHFAFVNDIVYNSLLGFGANEGAVNHSTGCCYDYIAIVGNLSANSSQDGICVAAIDPTSPGNFDSASGTHIYIYNNIVWNSVSASCISVSDSEDMMLDTYDAHGFTGQTVVSNNMGWTADRMCFNIPYGNFNPRSNLVIKVYNNTCFGNLVNIGGDGPDGEINLTGDGTTAIATLSITNNIAQTNRASSGSGGSNVYAAVLGGATWPNLIVGGSSAQNVFSGMAPSCAGVSCDPGNNITEYNNNTLGINFYVNPGFNNTSDLLSNRNGIPNCTGFANTTSCMGYNPNTQILTNPSAIYDLQPTCGANCAGKGFQNPSAVCVSSGPLSTDYPAWLKGIVYLQWNACTHTITENNDLVTKPCGM